MMESATITGSESVELEKTSEVVQVFRKVLVAVDEFDTDLSAVKLAETIGVTSGATVQVVHVRERESYGRRTFTLETTDEAQALVERAVGDLRRAGLKAEGTLTTAWVGRTWQAILAAAAAYGADAIVVGSVGPNHLFGGRTRERLLRKSSVPVLVAPRPAAGVVADRAPQADHSVRRRAA